MTRPVSVLTTGGTIAMAGDTMAVPMVRGDALLAEVPGLDALPDLLVETVCEVASSHLDNRDAFEIARAAMAHAARGRGVVVTHGTDTLEETAYLTDVMYDGNMPIVFTGAMRTAGSPGADGPVNLADSIAVAASDAGIGHGVLVVFAGRVHAARYVRKMDSTAMEPFGSAHSGPIGVILERRVNIGTSPLRRPPVVASHLDFNVPIVPSWLGDDGTLLRAAVSARANGLVVQTLGAGHLGPRALAAIRDAAGVIPVVATTRPERGAILYETYGFEGKEADVREVAVAAGGLSSPAARMKLLACLGASLTRSQIAEVFQHDDT